MGNQFEEGETSQTHLLTDRFAKAIGVNMETLDLLIREFRKNHAGVSYADAIAVLKATTELMSAGEESRMVVNFVSVVVKADDQNS